MLSLSTLRKSVVWLPLKADPEMGSPVLRDQGYVAPQPLMYGIMYIVRDVPRKGYCPFRLVGLCSSTKILGNLNRYLAQYKDTGIVERMEEAATHCGFPSPEHVVTKTAPTNHIEVLNYRRYQGVVVKSNTQTKSKP